MWYWSENNKSAGPVEFKEIERAVASGWLKKNNLCYQTQEGRWRPLGELAVLRQHFHEAEKLIENIYSTDTTAEWVVLKVDSSVKQIGPMSLKALRRGVEQGQWSLFDKAWRKGQKGWLPIWSISLVSDAQLPLHSFIEDEIEEVVAEPVVQSPLIEKIEIKNKIEPKVLKTTKATVAERQTLKSNSKFDWVSNIASVALLCLGIGLLFSYFTQETIIGTNEFTQQVRKSIAEKKHAAPLVSLGESSFAFKHEKLLYLTALKQLKEKLPLLLTVEKQRMHYWWFEEFEAGLPKEIQAKRNNIYWSELRMFLENLSNKITTDELSRTDVDVMLKQISNMEKKAFNSGYL